MPVKLIDAGYSSENGQYGITVSINGEDWFIPTDASTVRAILPVIEAWYHRAQ